MQCDGRGVLFKPLVFLAWRHPGGLALAAHSQDFLAFRRVGLKCRPTETAVGPLYSQGASNYSKSQLPRAAALLPLVPLFAAIWSRRLFVKIRSRVGLGVFLRQTNRTTLHIQYRFVFVPVESKVKFIILQRYIFNPNYYVWKLVLAGFLDNDFVLV